MTIATPPSQAPEASLSLQPTGWLKYFSFSLDHKVIGLQYIVCGFLFYLVGGALAGVIRTELATPISDFVSRDTYNQVLTLHGTVMIFLWIVPVVNGGFGNYLIPFYVGARDMAFPRLNAVAFWMIPPSGLLLISSYFIGPKLIFKAELGNCELIYRRKCCTEMFTEWEPNRQSIRADL